MQEKDVLNQLRKEYEKSLPVVSEKDKELLKRLSKDHDGSKAS